MLREVDEASAVANRFLVRKPQKHKFTTKRSTIPYNYVNRIEDVRRQHQRLRNSYLRLPLLKARLRHSIVSNGNTVGQHNQRQRRRRHLIELQRRLRRLQHLSGTATSSAYNDTLKQYNNEHDNEIANRCRQRICHSRQSNENNISSSRNSNSRRPNIKRNYWLRIMRMHNSNIDNRNCLSSSDLKLLSSTPCRNNRNLMNVSNILLLTCGNYINSPLEQNIARLYARKRRLRKRRKRKPISNELSYDETLILKSSTTTTIAATKTSVTPTTYTHLPHLFDEFRNYQQLMMNTSSEKKSLVEPIDATTTRTILTSGNMGLCKHTMLTSSITKAATTSNIIKRSSIMITTSEHRHTLSKYYATTIYRLILTTLMAFFITTTTIALTATTTCLASAVIATTTTLPTLLQKQLKRCYSCKLINGLNKYSWIFLLIYLNLSAKVCLAGYHEKRLLHDLLDPYNTLERPVLNESDPLQLSFGLTLMQIIDVDEKNQLLVTNVWLKLEWNDMNLRWNTSDYGGVKDLRIPPHRIWKPDVLMYNSADEGFDGTYQTNVVVRNNGSCLYVPPGIFKSTCKIDITWFPFDDQRCEMKFGSWTYDGFQLDLQLQDETGGDISSYVLNGEWELLGVPGKRNEIYYNCCPEPYIDITFAIIIRRRTLYYFFNLIIPCVLIASMALLGFTLPPDSGEKLSLGVTILLSLTVFLNMVAETMPATSDAVPLLGTYFNCIMFMVASSVVSTILILNYHHRNADTHEMSEWVRIVFLCWLPWILRMSRPGRPLILEFPTTPCSDTSSERKHQILSDVELKERSSKSLLANVLDIDDDFRHNCRPMTPGGTLPHNPAFYRTVYGQGDDGSIGPIGSTRMPDAVTHHTCIKSATEYELSLILKEIRFITDQLRKEDEDNDIANDWKFAAMVVDRLCLIIFTMFTILATIAVLLSAPHIIVS